MRRPLAVAVAALSGLLALGPIAALAHQGNPNMQSVVRTLRPQVPGISLQVLNRDDRFQLTNRGAATVVVQGYDGEPYARLTPDGSVAVNHHSPAFYLNTDRYGAVTVRRSASAKATPDWHVIDRTGVFEWHDHRMHYMARGVPGQVTDRGQRTKVFDYRIPIRIGGEQGAILGTLWWAPPQDGGPPVAALVALAVLVLAGGAAGLAVRRRRRGTGSGDRAEAAEAW